MKTAMFLICAMLLTSCATQFNQAIKELPSVKDCSKVSYIRTGNNVQITATCAIPLADSPLLTIAP